MAPMSTSQIDVIYKNLGAPGQFTIRQLLCLSLGAFPCGFQVLSNVFIGQIVSYRCAHPSNESALFSKYLSDANYNVTYNQCSIMIHSNDVVIEQMDCLYGYHYDKPKDFSVISEFDLVCSKSPIFHLTQTLLIAGQGLGGVIATVMADRLGRRPITVGATFGLLITGIAIAFAPNYFVFAGLKFLVGAFQQAYLSGSMTLFMEMLTAKNRRWSTTIEGCKWISSIMGLSLVAFLCRHQSWRVLQLILSLSALPAFFQLWYIKESLRWLIANGKSKEAVNYIKYAANVNGKKYEDIIQVWQDDGYDLFQKESPKRVGERDNSEHGKDPETELHCTTSRKLNLLDIMKIRSLLINCLVMWCAWFTAIIGFFALYLISSPMVGDLYLNFFLNVLIEIPALLFIYLTLNRLGRKKTLTILFSLLSVGLSASGIIKSLKESQLNSVLAVIGSLIALFGASGAFRIVYSYTLELFPTNVRNQALGLASFVGRVGGMTAPFMTVLGEKFKWAPGVLIGCLSFTVACLLKLLPETSDKELPQTVEEVYQWEKTESRDDKDSNSIQEKLIQ